MSFSVLYESTTADYSVVNANFQYIANGSIYPMGGTNLDNTTGVDNLGSATYPWKTIYANRLKQTYPYWTLITELTITSATTSIQISGLNGDVDKQYLLICYMPSHVSYIAGCAGVINGDSTSSYFSKFILCEGTSINTFEGGSIGFTTSAFILNVSYPTTITTIALNKTIIDANSDFYKNIFNIEIDYHTSAIMSLVKIYSIYENTSTMTSLTLFRLPYGTTHTAADLEYPVGTYFSLWRLG